MLCIPLMQAQIYIDFTYRWSKRNFFVSGGGKHACYMFTTNERSLNQSIAAKVYASLIRQKSHTILPRKLVLDLGRTANMLVFVT